MEQKVVITVIGRDTIGIIANVTRQLAQHNVNILNISQTIVDGFFNMMMIVDCSQLSIEFGDLANELETLGKQIGVKILCQRSEIFTTMHRM